MEQFVGKASKFLDSPITVQALFTPAFSMDVLLAIAACVVPFLVVYEINKSVMRTNRKAAAKRRLRRGLQGFSQDCEVCSYHSVATYHTPQVSQKKPERALKAYRPTPPNIRKGRRICRSRSSIGIWSMDRGDSIRRHKYSATRVEFLLSITPSEYVRADKEKRNRKHEVCFCMQSLTSKLAEALSNDTLEISNMFKDAIKNSINTLGDGFELLSDSNYQINNFSYPSLRSFADQNNGEKALKSSQSSVLFTSMSYASNLTFFRNINSLGVKSCKSDNDIQEIETANMSTKSSKSIHRIF